MPCAVFCWPNTRAIGAEHLDWLNINYYWNYWNNWPTTSYSLLEQICFGADERQSRWHSLEWSPLILCLQSSAATSIDRCVQHRALRVMCVWSLVHEHLFSSVVAPLPYWGRSSRSHNKRNPKNRLIVNHRWLPALKDELLPPRPLCNKGNAEGSAGTS